jgi:hypothetical protein
VAVLTVKPVSDDSGRFGAEGGIDLFAGKSEITEGCSDLREIGDLPLCGCQRAVRRKAGRRRKSWTPAESRMLRCGVKRMLLMMRHFDAAGAAAIGGSGVAGLHPFDFSSRPRASRSYGQVLRSIDI